MSERVTQEQLLEILCAFDELCSKYDIHYSLHGGTLLGAVRDGGFIPWDDDVDVIMTRTDFKELELVLNGSESNCYIRGNVKKQFCQTGNPNAWVDIFVCDYISENKVPQKVKQLLLTMLDIMHRDSASVKLSNLAKYSITKQLLYRIVYLIGQLFPKKWIAYCYANISEKWLRGKKRNMFRSNDKFIGRKLVFPAVWMQEYKYVQFENVMLPVCSENRAILIQSYGENYMAPIREDRSTEVHNLIRAEHKINL